MYGTISQVMPSEFAPPILSTEIISMSEVTPGTVNSVSLFVVDSLKTQFTLHVVTQEASAVSTLSSENDVSDFEPEFVVPGESISVEDVELITQIDPELLKKYLVPQE